MLLTLVALVATGAAGAGVGATNAPAGAEPQLGEEYRHARWLVEQGRDRDAEPILRVLLRRHPDHPAVRRLLEQIQARRAAAPDRQLRAQLEKLIVPEIEVRDAEATAVVEWLRAESARLSADGTPVNIVLLAPAEARLGRISLSLRNIPLLDALRYAAEAAGLTLRVESHAVVLERPGPAAARTNEPPSSAPHAEP